MSNPGNDFAAFSCDFQNFSLCGSAPGNIATDYWFNWPIGQWSARVRVDGRQAYVQAGVYEVSPRDLDEQFTLGHWQGAKGVLVPFEIAWTPSLAGRSGTYRIGGWHSTGKGADPGQGPRGRACPESSIVPTTLRQSSRSGIWIDVEQRLSTRAGSEGLSIFFNFTQADRRTSRIDQQISTGLFYGGLLPSRPADVTGVGLAQTHLNDPAAAGQAGSAAQGRTD